VIIDDEEDLLDVMRMVLERKGIAVQSFSAPPSLQEVEALAPRVIFLDLLLKASTARRFAGPSRTTRPPPMCGGDALAPLPC
jgi:CheY-like chemotaxis protein